MAVANQTDISSHLLDEAKNVIHDPGTSIKH